MKKKDRIPTDAANTGLSTPFEKLSTEGLPAAAPLNPASEVPVQSAKRGRVVLRRETAHRNGKTVIVVHDFSLQTSGALIEELAKKLKKACGCGGTTRDRTIEIQGDQPAKIRALLEAEGFRVTGVR
jgi:translation initiation factor 1